jgi:hypothetical protein
VSSYWPYIKFIGLLAAGGCAIIVSRDGIAWWFLSMPACLAIGAALNDAWEAIIHEA